MDQTHFVRRDLAAVRKSFQPLDLFLFSAATWNGHRVHYDQDYVERVEGHGTLLVQGPLQAVQMVQVLVDVLVERAAIRTVNYRHLRALHAGEEAVMSGALADIEEATGIATFDLWVQRAVDGEPTTTGTASVRLAASGDVV